MKDRKGKVNFFLEVISEKKYYVEYCKQLFFQVKDSGLDIVYVCKFYEVKYKIDEIKKIYVNKVVFDI